MHSFRPVFTAAAYTPPCGHRLTPVLWHPVLASCHVPASSLQSSRTSLLTPGPAHTRLRPRAIFRARISSRNLVLAGVRHTCCQKLRECVWADGVQGLDTAKRARSATPKRANPDAHALVTQIGSFGQSVNESKHALARFLAATKSIHTKRGPAAPFLATTYATRGRRPCCPYSAMSFWMRSMASTVASASPKAVRRT